MFPLPGCQEKVWGEERKMVPGKIQNLEQCCKMLKISSKGKGERGERRRKGRWGKGNKRKAGRREKEKR